MVKTQEARLRPAVCQHLRWLLTGNGGPGSPQTPWSQVARERWVLSTVAGVTLQYRSHYIRSQELLSPVSNVGVMIHPALVIINVQCKHETAYSEAHLSVNRNNDLLHADQTRAVLIIQTINWVNDRDNWMKYFDILFGLGLQGESWYNTRLYYKLLWRVARNIEYLGEGCWTDRGKIFDILRRVCILDNNTKP